MRKPLILAVMILIGIGIAYSPSIWAAIPIFIVAVAAIGLVCCVVQIFKIMMRGK